MSIVTAAHPPLVVWRLCDGKPGHESQSLGLVQALGERQAVQCHDIKVKGGWRGWLNLLRGRCPAGAGLPAPSLLIGAGHATHPALLACRRAHGGRAVVLMRPSLPLRCFDLCIVPAHDRVATRDNVLQTRGALNPVRPGAAPDPGLGLILLGGPSRHYGWDDDALTGQLEAILARGDRRWVLTTSRRTPDSMLAALRHLPTDRLQIVPFRDTAPGWMASMLQQASAAWVSADSVSMVYEVLSAGLACGLLSVPLQRPGRVSRGAQQLLADGLVVSFADWQAGSPLQPPVTPLNEAARCADWIVTRWLAN